MENTTLTINVSASNFDWFEKYLWSLIDVFVANEAKLNELDSITNRGDFGTKICLSFQSTSPNIKIYRSYGPRIALYELSTFFLNSFNDNFGKIISEWTLKLMELIEELPNLELKTLAPAITEATNHIKKTFKLDVKDKSFFTIWEPVQDVLNKNVDLPPDQLYKLMLETAENALIQSKQMRSRYGRSNYLGKRSIGLIDPTAYAMYLAIKVLVDETNNQSSSNNRDEQTNRTPEPRTVE